MSRIAETVKTTQNKDEMLRRALERIIQLYTDKSHFVYELLQNAEDAEAHCIRFIQYADRLEVFHDGKPFTSSNLQGLCDIGKSDKADNLNQIGEFGVGFKSVFGICDTVRLYSAPDHFRDTVEEDTVPFAVEIKDFTRPEDIQEEPMPSAYTTRFVFPYAVGYSFSGFATVKALNDTLSRKLQNLGITTLLFMHNLELIEYQIETADEPIKGEYLLEKNIINDHCVLVSALGAADQKNSNEEISYLKFSRKIEKYPLRTVDIAFPVAVDENGYQCIKAPSPYVSVYFPTETESKLDFIVQGPYRTTPNRSSIPAEDEDNVMLAEETAILLKESIIELKRNGSLNMSFIKALPISEERFSAFGLFLPLYEAVKRLFHSFAVIPTRMGGYVSARFARIARQERLVSVFTDDLLSALINDGNKYSWLSTNLTETNREYKGVLEFFNGELGIPVLRPEDMRTYFAQNPAFLPARSDDWLISLYGIYENIPGLFSKTKNDTNLLTAEIIKTSKGIFAAPFRKEGKTYIPNVFIPSSKVLSDDILFVDQNIYDKCRHFFDDILQLQKPNEYEFIVRDIKKRYETRYVFEEEKHIADIKALLKYSKYDDYKDEVIHIIKNSLVLRCIDGNMRSAYSMRVFLPESIDGVKIESYYRNVVQSVYFVDTDFYESHDISKKMLIDLGVRDSLLLGEEITGGTYDTGSRGKQPNWWTPGDFRWRLSADALKDVLNYISLHATAKDSILKSQTIMKLLILNEARICGSVHIGGNTPNLEKEPCEMIHILRGERTRGWNGKWLYTESGDLVSPKEVSKHDISTSIYGRLKPDSIIYELLGFKKTEADKVDDLRKTVTKEQLDALFESELRNRYGISSADLNERYGETNIVELNREEDTRLPFPTANVKNFDTLKKHAAEMLIYAAPVDYQLKIRSIRVSNRPKEAKAYLSNMYRHEGVYKYACQLCHDTCSSFERTELFLNPATELDPINLCLCPNCAAAYRAFRNDYYLMSSLRNTILSKTDLDITAEDHVEITIDDDDALWFTQTHFAEIRELLRLSDEVKNSKTEKIAQISGDDEAEKSGLSVYAGYIGKTIRRKDGFEGVIENVDDQFLHVHVTKGKDAGKKTKIQLSFVILKNSIYSFSDN